MPIHATGDEHSGFVQYGESGAKYEYGPGKKYRSRQSAWDAARKQEIAINLSQARRGEKSEWEK